MDKQTKQIVGSILVLAIALVSWFLREETKKHPPAETPSTEKTQPKTTDGEQPPPFTADTSIHVLMGDPSRASSDTNNHNNYYMAKPYFALSYNDSRGGPNWVSWRLQKSDLGPGNRVDFYPDTTLPQGFRRIVPHDYSNTGFDRGHLCPRSDRTATQEMANATFVMTNIIPQSPHLNQRGWADLEEYCRGLARDGRTLYIVAGGSGVGGEGAHGRADAIAGSKVTVPAKCWKVMVILENGTGTADDLGKVGPTTRTIAIIMPNDPSIGHTWAKYRTSVQQVETLTGYKFFDRVPAAIIDPLKAKVDDVHIPPVGKPTGD